MDMLLGCHALIPGTGLRFWRFCQIGRTDSTLVTSAPGGCVGFPNIKQARRVKVSPGLLSRPGGSRSLLWVGTCIGAYPPSHAGLYTAWCMGVRGDTFIFIHELLC